MVDLSVEEIIEIHNQVVKRFNITTGVLNQGTLEALIDRPNITVNGKEVYPDIFSKAACLLEGVIRWHPFADGNKRTALLVMIYYMKLEGYGVALPLSAVRYTVKIAKNKKIDDKSTKKLLQQITNWIRDHSGKTEKQLLGKVYLFVLIPYKIYGFLYRIGFHKFVERKFEQWLAFDIYPEYQKEASDILNFLNETLEASLNVFKDDNPN